MTKTKITALVLVMLMLVVAGLPVAAEAESVTAYLTVSCYGEIVTDKNGESMALAEVELSGKESYSLDDLFIAAHQKYYDGDGGYESATGEWGLYITSLWGDTSGNFGYQVNGGSEMVMGLEHEVSDGDYIDAVIYKNSYPDTEGYAAFDKYTAEVVKGEKMELTLVYASGYDENWNTVYSPCTGAKITIDGKKTKYVTDDEGRVSIPFKNEGVYIVSAEKTKKVNKKTVPAITAPVCQVTVESYPDACITVPKNAQLFVGQKTGAHFVSFTQMECKAKERDGGVTHYYFDLENDRVYNYRITHNDYVTYTGKFTKTENFELTVSEKELKAGGAGKNDTDRDVLSNNGYNVADIYLNINAQGHLTLDMDETYQLIPLRNWEAVDSVTGNYFIEPDFNYQVINKNGKKSDEVIKISSDGVITAVGEGTAIVLVTYDALKYQNGAGGPFFGAIWSENTGVFVVSVGEEHSEISAGMTINEGMNPETTKLSGDFIDAEHDVIYFTGDEGSYTFTPNTEGCEVFVANPVISDKMSFNGFVPVGQNEDASFTVPLTEGRNIVEVSAEGQSSYQVITAKQVSYTVNDGDPVYPGDTVRIVFDRLYHPANKLAGVYNMSALPVYTEVYGYEDSIIGGLPVQYNFASDENAQTVSSILCEKDVWGMITYEKQADLVVPEDIDTDVFTLSGGMLYAVGYGDAYGNHRGITLTDGKAPNLTADARLGWLGRLPDISIPVETDAEITRVEFNTEGVKTDYFEGDSFDASGITITATFDDGRVIDAKNFTVLPATLKKSTDKVTINYRGEKCEIDVNVSPLEVVDFEVTTPPVKTEYKGGEVFDPTGMVVSYVYNNGKKEVANDYKYEPKRALEQGDTQIRIIGRNGETVKTPITVSGYAGGNASDKITVYFTLLGDKKHGDDGKVHTKTKDNLDVWVERTSVLVDRNSTVLDVIKKVLGTEGIPYQNPTGEYIESIRGLGELDNGDRSGWMYTVNGKYPDKGIAEQGVKKGDKIILHYTDDYSLEKDEKDKSDSAGGTTTTTKPSAEKPQQTQKPVQTKPVFSADTFGDVAKNDWYFESVEYVYENSLMQGTEKGFEPEVPMTRAMLVTVLHRMAGQPAANGTAFKDVPKSAWYADAVLWAQTEGIVSGISQTHFAPDENITREQLAVIMYRFAAYCKLDTGAKADIKGYNDADNVSAYAGEAMQYAVANGLLKGKTQDTLNPKDYSTRAEIATILMRFCAQK